MAVSFDFKKRLGSGYFGEVWHAIDTGLQYEVALKCIPPDKILNKDNFFQEAQILKASEHPNIVHVNDTGHLADGRIYVSMEYLSRGSVEDAVQGAPMPLRQAKKLMVDVLRGVGYAHSQGILHRDIKPANILLGDGGEGKVSDFGLAIPIGKGLDISNLKEYQYILHLAPEVRRVQDYSPLSDVYAAGVTLYRMINGDSMLPQVSLNEAQRMARRGEFPPRNGYRDYVPQALKRMINKAINPDPIARYQSADDMRHALERQDIRLDWSESNSPSKTVWRSTTAENVHYEVKKFQSATGKWTVETRHGKQPAHLRRISEFCLSGLTKQVATRESRRILQALVTGRL